MFSKTKPRRRAVSGIKSADDTYDAPDGPYVTPLTIIHLAFSFRGRIARTTFWVMVVSLLAFEFVCLLLLAVVSGSLNAPDPVVLLLTILGFSLWIWLAVHVKRYHDMGVTGWAAVINLIPVVNLVSLVILGASPGQPFDNEYGVDPLAPSNAGIPLEARGSSSHEETGIWPPPPK